MAHNAFHINPGPVTLKRFLLSVVLNTVINTVIALVITMLGVRRGGVPRSS